LPIGKRINLTRSGIRNPEYTSKYINPEKAIRSVS